MNREYSIKIDLSREYLREIFNYNSDTGEVTWRVRTSIRNMVGNRVGTVNKNGYHIVTINYRRYRLHRLIWIYLHGAISNYMDIDHINGNPSDNRQANLRLASRSQNNANIGRRKKLASSKYKGVCFDKSKNKWKAQIDYLGKHYNLGRFPTEELAYGAYCNKARELHKSFFHQ